MLHYVGGNMLKELKGLHEDAARLRVASMTKNPHVAMLCSLLESFTDESTILLLAEEILRKRRICSVEFAEKMSSLEDDYEYDPHGLVQLRAMSHENEITEVNDHESILHAFHEVPEFPASQDVH